MEMESSEGSQLVDVIMYCKHLITVMFKHMQAMNKQLETSQKVKKKLIHFVIHSSYWSSSDIPLLNSGIHKFYD